MKWWLILLLVWNNAEAQRVYMTSLDWPPYSGEALPENGLSVAIAREAFAAMGYELVVEFKPWVRTVTTASKREKYIGYFPEYAFDTEKYIFSDSIGTGPLGFVQNRNKAISWSTLADLSSYRIGVVQGYVNTRAFDQWVEQGKLDVEASENDVINIHKVAKGRLDLAVIDANVLKYLVDTDRRKSVLETRVEMNDRLLEVKQLYLAFKNSPEGNNWRRIFNQGLSQVDVNRVAGRLYPTDNTKHKPQRGN
ncbi:amino acid ABC transporter substrate-binding protein [Vibrio sp. JPW-9-11-11]|uniref:substrate-binding periplasmic protein n=1 Tax=Vibrio sp. JPW-9-11-11 TaxID=1416532 RepID=UPI0015934AFE|nr:ABC transporter substrate-binding protein [Vibrio sp. JPW-9-11-11]NVD06309.1 amino acid ABC transporter substrate-binding protein [Vibrio sp. JPW-9-11-11]